MTISMPLKLCPYLVPFLGYSASKNFVTLKWGYRSFKVIDHTAVQKIIYHFLLVISILLALCCTIIELIDLE